MTGLTLEQVDELYLKVPVAWKSKGFKPTVSFQEVAQAGVDTRRMSLADAEDAVFRRKSSIAHGEHGIGPHSKLPEKV
jgi:MFS transporter, SP family, sugar:H+ symporter